MWNVVMAGEPTIAPEERVRPGVRHPPHLLWVAGVIAGALALLLIVGSLVGSGPLVFDRAIVRGLRQAADATQPIGPPWLRGAMIDITALGGETVLTLAVMAACVLLATRRRWWTALVILAATISGSIAVAQVKLQVGRGRPEIVDHLVQVSGMSFPSGHAANSAIVYLTIAALASQVVHGRATRTAIIAGAVLLVGAIGVSRVYLGVHWPSDVLAGWSFGMLWALAWWWVAARIRPPHAR
jgi:undecaprenyl-diphosphatase